MSNAGRLPVSLLVATFASGAAALIYESLWTRSLMIILGSTVQASAVVFAAFLVGLALGAYLFSKLDLSGRRVIRAYVLIEIGIAVVAPAVGLLLDGAASELAFLAGAHGSALRVPRALLIVLVLTLPPTALIGGTLPVLLALVRRLRGDMAVVSGIYALNTAGAAFGALACGVYLVAHVGASRSLLLSGAMNAAAALMVWATVAELPEPAAPRPESKARDVGFRDPRTRSLLLVVAFASGFLVLAVEVVWSRLGSFFLGNRIYAVTFLLTWVLILLSAGSSIAGRLFRRFRDHPSELFAGLLLVASLAIVLTGAAGFWWIEAQDDVEAGLPGAGQLLLLYRLLEVGLLLSPAILTLGCLFPATLMFSEASVDETATTVGRLYGVNTAGAVLGSLSTAWIGVPALGTPLWLIVLAALAALIAAPVALLRPRVRARALFAVVVLAPLAVGLGAAALLPLELAHNRPGEKLLVREEDEHGVFQLTQTRRGWLRATHNKTELVFLLGSPQTSFVQEMQGHLGMFYCPDADTAVVLGSGFGITAGALGLYEGLERVDAVEIVPAMVEAAPLFEPENHAYQDNPRVNIAVDDGRHFLAIHPERYDIISINVSDPHIPGSSGLFHREFYDLVKERLSERGVMVQHAFGLDLDVILRTLGDSFPYVKLFPAYGNGVNVVAALHPLETDPAAVQALLTPPVEKALAAIGIAAPADVSAWLSAAYERDDFVELDDPSLPVASDDRPFLEFSTRGGQEALFFSNE